MNTPLVSTITPCFKMKPYLKKFLEELPHQTYFNHLEVVLDHNEPDHEEILWVKDFQKQYPDKIKHIIVNPVEPIGTSMNRCIQEASGELLTIWNVDDLRTPTSIESQVKAILEKHGDIAIGDYKIVRKFGEKEEGHIVLHGNVPDSEFKRGMYYGPFMMFKKALCEKAGYFDEQLVSGADFDLSVRLAYNGRTVMADDMLGYYLNEGKGASTRPGSKQGLDKAIICLRYGIFDRIEMEYIPLTVNYLIPHIISFGKIHLVSSYVHDYNNILLENRKNFSKSIIVSAFKSITNYSVIKMKFKFYIKKYILK